MTTSQTSKNKITQLSKRKIAVEIKNSNQEKEFRHLCLENGEMLVKKDDTAYRVVNGKRKAIYPIYYAFVQLGERRTTWWTLHKEEILNQDYLITSFVCFKEMVGEQK